MTIAGKTALVIGAGIGAATALAAAGAAPVHVGDIDADAAHATATLIEAAGVSARAHHVDVGSTASLRALFDAVAIDASPDIVVNSAGIVSGSPDFPDTSAERAAAVVAINLAGTVGATLLAVERMRQGAQGGAIVNIASRAADDPDHPDPVYAASKAGAVLFTRNCRSLHERYGIRVNAVCPAIVDTALLDRTGCGKADWLIRALSMVEPLSAAVVAHTVVALAADDGAAGRIVHLVNHPREAGGQPARVERNQENTHG